MKYYLFFLKYYLNLLGLIMPKIAGKKAFNVFQTVRLKTVKKREAPFYEIAKPFTLKLDNDELHCYEMGNPDGDLVILVHGWNSNAGSLLLFAKALAAKGFRVISFDHLAHHKSTKKYTNLYETKKAFGKLLAYLNPQKPFSLIGHSFGASAIAYTLKNTNYEVNKIVLLSSNDMIINVFYDFQKAIGFNNRVFNNAKLYIDKLIHDDFAKMSTATNYQLVNYKKLLIIHDKKDKVIPYTDAINIQQKTLNSTLISFERIGHYRMLWNTEVLNETVKFLS